MKLTLAAIALVGLSAPALAADIDEIAPYAQPDFAVEGNKGVHGVLERAGSNKGTTTTRTKSGPKGTVQQRQVTNGNRTATATRARTEKDFDGSVHKRNGDWVHGEGTRTQTRGQFTVTNGTKTASRDWSQNQRTGEVEGVRNGERFAGDLNQRQERVTSTQSNARTGNTATRTTRVNGQHVNGVKGGQPVHRTVVNHNARHPAARPPLAVPNHARAHTRPGTTVVTRPGGHPVVRHPVPARPRTVVVNRPGPSHVRPGPVVVRRPAVRTVSYTRVRPYHGVFVYGPRPATHVHYHGRAAGPVKVKTVDMPSREVDRDQSVAIGFKGGSLISGTTAGQVYGDPGLAMVGRYRPAESVGLEFSVGHHANAFGSAARQQTQAAGSVALFAFPWTRVSPYVIGGVTWNGANFQDEVWVGNGYDAVQAVDSQWGLHGGLGLELALGKSLALDLEGRYIGWVDERLPNEAPGAVQATAGLLFHFK